jgi:hypothetical protein
VREKDEKRAKSRQQTEKWMMQMNMPLARVAGQYFSLCGLLARQQRADLLLALCKKKKETYP